jgi:Ca2+-transporting ATPase
MIQSVSGEMTPLQKRLDQLGKGLALAAVVIVAIVFVLGLLRGEEVRLMFMTAISMAVAAVPEGLPAVVTIALALGAQRMLKRNALIRKLPAVETLGSVTVICTDKTGTLTENRMTVSILDVAGNTFDVKEHALDYSPFISAEQVETPAILEKDAVPLLLVGGALCNDAVMEPVEDEQGGFATVGDPTEGALVVAAARFGLWKKELEKAFPRVAELPFDSERKRMSTVHKINPDQMSDVLIPIWQSHPEAQPMDHLLITKGAVDQLLEVSDRVWDQGRVTDIDAGWHKRILAGNDQLAAKGMRVLGVAFRRHDSAEIGDEALLERNLVFVGMVGMIDPARPEVEEAVDITQTAGIHPVMITGDHPLTALAIAKSIGISEKEEVITGQQLATMELSDLEARVEDIPVYARVSPEHKLKIVESLQKRGHIVAMTGDGVNDAPALKRADIGVAMGITGTDVSKEASDMILLDDNFATIVSAVREGRRIYDNIRKFIRYTMTSNAGEIWVMLLAPFLGMPLPLTPIQILWVNLVTDGLPGLALTIEKEERDTMERPPYPPDENIFGRGMIAAILWVGLLIGLLSLGVGYVLFRADQSHWQTVVFTTLTLTQMGNAFATRSERDTTFRIGFFSNPAMLGAVGLTLLLQLAVIYVPFLQGIFKTAPLTFGELMVAFGLGVITFLAIELVKWLRYRGKNGEKKHQI